MTDPSDIKRLLDRASPGPWAMNPVVAQVDAFVGNEPLAVCQMLWPTDERDEVETEANAALIAAAPDIARAYLEQCERVRVLEDELAAMKGGAECA